MTSPFDGFIMLAGMRTGSNLLEEQLRRLPGLTSHGEAFNPTMFGHPKTEILLGMTRDERDADPLELLRRMRAAPGMTGFRYFHDHDPRIFEPMMDDPRIAKIVLTRNPVESWVSLQIARTTGQWRLSDGRRRRAAQAVFDAADFEAHLAAQQDFQLRVLHRLQTTGQTAFYLNYDDLHDREVLDGLARWLGFADGMPTGGVQIVPQNPEELALKVANFDQMEQSLARLDRFNLSRTPSFEPRRGPNVPSFVAADDAGLLFMPVRGGPEAGMAAWLTACNGGAALRGNFARKDLRQWMQARPGHRRLTVVRHPLVRAHRVFTDLIVRGAFPAIRDHVSDRYKAKLPPLDRVEKMKPEAFRTAFLAFLTFLRANLAGQTPVRVDPAWASQAEVIQGFGQFAPPDLVLPEADLPRLLAALFPDAPAYAAAADDDVVPLAAIRDAELDQAARAAWPRDYLLFGFADGGL
ncbi:nodulation protein NodH [Paracoccus sp. p3-h83]|uniref:nodulation protein NodH n=1 Tax=Paracoccus sp. p3-h83 TaxID=3342805 RepID=UPI0035B8B175